MLIIQKPEIALLPEKRIELLSSERATNGVILLDYVWDIKKVGAGAAAPAADILSATVFDVFE